MWSCKICGTVIARRHISAVSTTCQHMHVLVVSNKNIILEAHYQKINNAIIGSANKVLVVGSARLFNYISCGAVLDDIRLLLSR
jgi:hypothetical protein